MKDIIIREFTQGNNIKIAIFTYTGDKNPKIYLDEAIRDYTKGEGFNQFIDSHLDNPWTRVVVLGLNEMEQKKYVKKH
ncbi:hypothetical protein VDP25_16920 [Winogradskyella sp. ECml5-4]|uniref:hypothetical protein n=1 Tax=Winogradskyella sp. ECml5-4 TaxID=3110975 RepID=UPI002FF3B113